MRKFYNDLGGSTTTFQRYMPFSAVRGGINTLPTDFTYRVDDRRGHWADVLQRQVV